MSLFGFIRLCSGLLLFTSPANSFSQEDSAVLFPKATPIGSSKVFKFELNNKASDNFVIEVGDYSLSGLLVEVELTNSSGSPVELEIKGSCGCTKLSDQSLHIPDKGKSRFSFSIAKVMAPHKLQLQIAIVDKSTTKRWVIGVDGQAVGDIEWTPQSLRQSVESREQVEIVFSPRFIGVKIEAIEALVPDVYIRSVDRRINGSWALILEPERDWQGKQLAFVVKQGSDLSSIISVPVLNPDKISIVSRAIVLRESAEDRELLTTNVILQGEDIAKHQKSITVFCDSGESRSGPGKVTITRQRTSNIIILGLAIPKNLVAGSAKCKLALSGKIGEVAWREVVFAQIEGRNNE